MIRQLIIGSLFGIAFGGVLTASIAHGVFVDGGEPASSRDAADTAGPDEADSIRAGSLVQPPLRPGSARVGLPPAVLPAPDVPVALDAQPKDRTPTV